MNILNDHGVVKLYKVEPVLDTTLLGKAKWSRMRVGRRREVILLCTMFVLGKVLLVENDGFVIQGPDRPREISL